MINSIIKTKNKNSIEEGPGLSNQEEESVNCTILTNGAKTPVISQNWICS
jgi:hypothetical protein